MSNPGGCYVHGLSTAVPTRSLNCDESIELLRQACLTPRDGRLLQRLARLTGIEKRHLAVLDRQTGDSPLYRPAAEQPGGPGMGARTEAFHEAAPHLLGRLLAGLPQSQLSRVGTLVTVSCTHASSPGLEQPLLAGGALPADVQRWNLGFMGCSGAMAAVRLVHRLVSHDQPALIVACELGSMHFQYTDQIDQMTANVLFADGAAGLLLSAKQSPVCVVDCACVTIPQFADQMVWLAGDHGLRLRLSPELAETIAAHLPASLQRFLAKNGLEPRQVAHWLVHPGGPQILDAVQDVVGLPKDALDLSRQVLRQFGNMSSPTILFILKELLNARLTGPTVALAFGPGLTIEIALLQISGQ